MPDMVPSPNLCKEKRRSTISIMLLKIVPDPNIILRRYFRGALLVRKSVYGFVVQQYRLS